MKELIEILQKIDTDFYNGGITFGQKYDLVNAIEEVANNHQKWATDYKYNSDTNEFTHIHKDFSSLNKERAYSWFEKSLR